MALGIKRKRPLGSTEEGRSNQKRARLAKDDEESQVPGTHQNGRLRGFRFLALPPEVRNIIYDYIFDGEEYMIKNSLKFKVTTKTNHPLALLAACRQTYEETKIMPYTRGVFRVDGEHLYYRTNMTKALRSIKTIIVDNWKERDGRYEKEDYPGVAGDTVPRMLYQIPGASEICFVSGYDKDKFKDEAEWFASKDCYSSAYRIPFGCIKQVVKPKFASVLAR
ncbi:unnamed protein product [Periconia digitata]|uniref:Uncharacterized protein n=1 Tax=Periconia digitata TaxID=1303443 RepID=A0A9W4U697_9PLEO|nr:unnamed protein product [Periconia digitata]